MRGLTAAKREQVTPVMEVTRELRATPDEPTVGALVTDVTSGADPAVHVL
jgi:hypothetical protein